MRHTNQASIGISDKPINLGEARLNAEYEAQTEVTVRVVEQRAREAETETQRTKAEEARLKEEEEEQRAKDEADEVKEEGKVREPSSLTARLSAGILAMCGAQVPAWGGGAPVAGGAATPIAAGAPVAGGTAMPIAAGAGRSATMVGPYKLIPLIGKVIVSAVVSGGVWFAWKFFSSEKAMEPAESREQKAEVKKASDVTKQYESETPLYTGSKDLINSGKSIVALIVSKDPAELRAALLEQDGHGNSLLHWAVHSDNARAIAKLMDGAQSFPGLLLEMFMVKDNAGSIPLLLALFRDKVNATNLLLDKALESAELFGALTVENNFGVSVLEKIISNKKGDLLARIIEKADDLGKLSDIANFKNSDGQSILELAKDSGAADIDTQIINLLSQVAQDDPALPITQSAEVLVASNDAFSNTDSTSDSNPLHGNEASATTSLNIGE